MKKWIVGMLAALMALSLCACGNGGDRSAASESISNSAWAAIVGETLGEDTYHILVFTDGGDGKGNVEYAIQVGDNTIYDVRGTFTMKKNNRSRSKTAPGGRSTKGGWTRTVSSMKWRTARSLRCTVWTTRGTGRIRSIGCSDRIYFYKEASAVGVDPAALAFYNVW